MYDGTISGLRNADRERKARILPLIAAGIAAGAGGLLHGIGNFFGAKSQADQLKKYYAEQEAKTLPYRTRQGAKAAGAFDMFDAIGKAYGVNLPSNVSGPMSSVIATPYTPAPVVSPSVAGTAFGMGGDLASSVGSGIQNQMTYEDFLKMLNDKFGSGGGSNGGGYSSSPSAPYDASTGH